MTADTETIREAAAKIERVLTTHWLTSVRGDEVHTAAFEAVGSIRASLGRVEERERALTEALRAADAILFALPTAARSRRRSEVYRQVRAALAGSVAGEQEEETE